MQSRSTCSDALVLHPVSVTLAAVNLHVASHIDLHCEVSGPFIGPFDMSGADPAASQAAGISSKEEIPAILYEDMPLAQDDGVYIPQGPVDATHLARTSRREKRRCPADMIHGHDHGLDVSPDAGEAMMRSLAAPSDFAACPTGQEEASYRATKRVRCQDGESPTAPTKRCEHVEALQRAQRPPMQSMVSPPRDPVDVLRNLAGSGPAEA